MHPTSTVKKPTWTRKSMNGSRWVLVILPILLLSSGGPALTESLNTAPQSLDSGDFSTSESEWFRADPSISRYELRPATGLLHSPFGPFDPIIDPIPLGPENLFDQFALERTGMLIVQSSSPDLTSMLALLEEFDLEVIDNFPDDSVVVRLSSEGQSTVIQRIISDD